MPASERYVVISSDCHAGADLRDYKPFLAREWHDDFERWAADFSDPWMAAEEKIKPGPINRGAVSAGSTWNWDSDTRMRALEEDGIVAEVLFPNWLAAPVRLSRRSRPGRARARRRGC